MDVNTSVHFLTLLVLLLRLETVFMSFIHFLILKFDPSKWRPTRSLLKLFY